MYMKLVAAYYFNKRVKREDWGIISENLTRLYPGIMWAGGNSIRNISVSPARILYIYKRGSDFKMKYADYVQQPDGSDISWTIESYVKNSGGQLINGDILIQPNWDETEGIFNQLDETIKKIIKEFLA